ncbi:MAG: DUF5686 family protein [Bacteroidota bacterium]
MKFCKYAFFLCIVCFSQFSFAQQKLSGIITDEQNIPIPNAKIYIKNDADQRTEADAKGYYEMFLLPGEYYIIYTTTGYQDREIYIGMYEVDIIRDVQLFPISINTFEEVEVSVKKTNPGRDIMLEVVKIRDKINPWNYPHATDVYIRATEKLDFKEVKNDKGKKNDDKIEDPGGIEDPFAEERKKNDLIANGMNLVEVQMNRYFAPPGKVKEIRNGYEKRGDDRNLYYTTTVKSNFNFFQNLLHLDDLHQTPVSSPISGPGILSYKYRLEKQYEENGRKISKIKIIPRMSSTSTLEGYIYVIDSLWLVQKLELTMNKGNLLIYDYFTIIQEFDHPGDTMCVLKNQTLEYGVKYSKETSKASTIATFSNYNFNPEFTRKFFNSEVAVTEQEAYDKDTSYWAGKRQIELTEEERKYIQVKDSIENWQNRKEYLDSIDANFNKVTFLKVLWFGIDHRDRAKKQQWTINSIAGTLRPVYVGGPRVAPGFYYFKKWKDERTLDSYTEVSYGFLNKDPKGRGNIRYRYDPFHFGTVKLAFEHEFDAVRSFDAITQIYKRNNFIEKTELRIGNDFELFNGFYTDVDLGFSERRSLKDFKFMTWLDGILPNDEPMEFNDYQALIANVTISYTPGQKYMKEPYRKVVLGSKWPTFYASYERGIPKLFGSDVNHEYGRVGIRQTFKIGTLGTSSYHITAAKFLSAKILYPADFRYQRRSEPIWFSNPLNSFQGLDSSLPSKDVFYEAHFVHHDNGAILNKIPFMKKTRIGLVVGAGALYVKEFNYFHYEFLAGLERNFKLSKRRLRIGIYGIYSDSNQLKDRITAKISFNILDDRNMKFNF